MVTPVLRRQTSVCSSVILLSATMVGFTATLGMASGTTTVAGGSDPAQSIGSHGDIAWGRVNLSHGAPSDLDLRQPSGF